MRLAEVASARYDDPLARIDRLGRGIVLLHDTKAQTAAMLPAFLRELKRRGMRLVLDGVFNHVGRGFWAFHSVLENGADSPYRTWFHLDDAVLRGERRFASLPPRV